MASAAGGSVKSYLKAARDHMTAGNSQEALKCCKAALKIDNNSYEALVFAGKASFALGDFDSAAAGYRRASQTNPAALPAWQGLAELHGEAGTKNPAELAEAARQVVGLSRNAGDHERAAEYLARAARAERSSAGAQQTKDTWQEVIDELAGVSSKQELFFEAWTATAEAQVQLYEASLEGEVKRAVTGEKKALKAAKKEREEGGGGGVELPDAVDGAAVRRRVQETVAAGEEGRRVEEIIRAVVHKVGAARGPQLAPLANFMVQLLMLRVGAAGSESDRIQALSAAAQFCHLLLRASCALTPAPYEALAAILSDDAAPTAVAPHAPSALLRATLQRLGRTLPTHGLARLLLPLTQATPPWQRRQLCQAALTAYPDSVVGWTLLASVEVEMEMEGAVAAANAGKGLAACQRVAGRLSLSHRDAGARLKLLQGQAEAGQGKVVEAEALYRSALHDLAEVRQSPLWAQAMQGAATAALAGGHEETARAAVEELLAEQPESHWALAERGWERLGRGLVEEAGADLRAAVRLSGEEASYRLRLGCVYWEAGGEAREGAQAMFLSAAKLQPDNAVAFGWLGRFYLEVGGDEARAARCFQKAVALDPTDRLSGETLCGLLERSGQVGLESSVCREATQASPVAFWAWRRLGLLQAHTASWAGAADSLQRALRGGDPRDFVCWEALGLAYQRLQRHTAALKAYARSVALQDSLFCRLQSGAVYLDLGEFGKAIEQFRMSLRLAPTPSGQCGLAAALHGRAVEVARLGAAQWAAELLHEALQWAEQCRGGGLGAPLKLTADILSALVSVLPCGEQKQRRAEEAVKFCTRALHLHPGRADLAADLALALHQRSEVEEVAERVAFAALALDPGRAQLWTVVGQVGRHPALRQHALIRALHMEPHSGPTWACLGQLYLGEGEAELGGSAFSQSRSCNPLLAQPWGAMAYLHSLHPERREEAYAEALYAVQQNPAPELELGLGLLAVRAGRCANPKLLPALAHCAFLLPASAAAANLLGLAAEANGECVMALQAYTAARALLPPGDGQGAAVGVNLGRALLKAGRAAEAVEVYSALGEGGGLGSPEWCLLAIALWRCGRGEEACAAVVQALQTALPGTTACWEAMALNIRLQALLGREEEAVERFCAAPEEWRAEKAVALTVLAAAVGSGKEQLVGRVVGGAGVLFQDQSSAAEAYRMLAVARAWKGGPKMAIASLRKACLLYPPASALRLALARLLHDSGHPDTAARLTWVWGSEGQEREAAVLAHALLCACAACATNRDHTAPPTPVPLARLLRVVHAHPVDVEARVVLLHSALVAAQHSGAAESFRSLLRQCGPLLPPTPLSTDSATAVLLIASECSLRSRSGAGGLATALHFAHQAVGGAGGREWRSMACLQVARCEAVRGGGGQMGLETAAALLGWAQCLLAFNRADEATEALAKAEGVLKEGPPTGSCANTEAVALRGLQALTGVAHADLEVAHLAAADALAIAPSPLLHMLHGAIRLEQGKKGDKEALLAARHVLRSVAKEAASPIAHFLCAEAEAVASKTASGAAKRASHLRSAWEAWPEPRPAALYEGRGQVGPGEDGEGERDDTKWLRLALRANPTCARYRRAMV